MAVVSTPTTSSNGKTTEPFLVDSYPSSPLNSKQVSENGSENSSPAVNSGPIDQSDYNYQSDSSSISRKDVEVQSPAYLKSEEYRLLFRLPTDEMLIQDFNCAFQESILLQGHMYLFIRHICFYSNIFGFETKKTIPFNEMTCVRKAKTAGIFPNAIEIVAGVKKYYFASFLSRDEAYRLIVDGWSQHINGTDVVIDHQDLKSEIVSEDRVGENCKGSEQQSNDLQPSDRNKDGDGDLSGASKLLLNGEDEVTVSSMPWEAHENGEEAAEPVLNSEPSSSRESLPWRVDDADAPKVPDYYTKVAESKFPVQVEELFNLFFSDKAVNFIASFRKNCGDKDFRCTPWSDDTQFGLSRQLSFQHPIKIYFGAKFGQCQEVQQLRVYRNSHLVIETSQDVSDVPYADYFRVEGQWIVERDGNESSNSCILRVYVNVAFLKKTMWKGKIEQSTMDECREAYSIWIDNAHALLKQQIEKLDGKTSAPDMNSSDAQLKGNERNESSLTHDISNDLLIPSMASDTTHGSPPMENSLGGNLSAAASFGLTIFRESLARFSVYLKSQNHLPLVLVVASVLILLMQLSIIVLLTRAPQVHLISQIDHMNGIGSSTHVLADAEAWLEKRIHYLKDEMHMVEARLEKMFHEHAMLKEHFKGLQLLRGARQ